MKEIQLLIISIFLSIACVSCNSQNLDSKYTLSNELVTLNGDIRIGTDEGIVNSSVPINCRALHIGFGPPGQVRNVVNIELLKNLDYIRLYNLNFNNWSMNSLTKLFESNAKIYYLVSVELNNEVFAIDKSNVEILILDTCKFPESIIDLKKFKKLKCVYLIRPIFIRNFKNIDGLKIGSIVDFEFNDKLEFLVIGNSDLILTENSLNIFSKIQKVVVEGDDSFFEKNLGQLKELSEMKNIIFFHNENKNFNAYISNKVKNAFKYNSIVNKFSWDDLDMVDYLDFKFAKTE